MSESSKSGDELAPFSTQEVRSRSTQPEPDLSEPRTISPFKVVHRNEDTLDADDNVIFSDFRPEVLPADAPELVEPVVEIIEEVAPKAESAPGPALSSGSMQTNVQQRSDNPVQTPADQGAGTANPNDDLKPDSSSGPKNGQSEPPV